MIPRRAHRAVEKALSRQAAVALMGPRQVGKTTLALAVAAGRPFLYLDLEDAADREKLNDPKLFLEQHTDKLVIFDEIHRMPALFEALRGIIDLGRRRGAGNGRFLLLGSAHIDLMRQSGETLAGRIEYVDLGTLTALEIAAEEPLHRLWLRGGFPNSYLADNDEDSFSVRSNFIRTYLERDVPQLGPRVAAETMGRLWTMLAHHHGSLLNASQLAASLGVSATTVGNYIDLLVDLLLVRRLRPYYINTSKRLIKAPKVYLRDSGLVHALLGIPDQPRLFGHPIVGMSWEGFVLENLLSVTPPQTQTGFYRTARGAEVDMVLDLGGRGGVWAMEIKHGLTPKPGRGFYQALEDIQPEKAFVVYSGTESYPLTEGIEVVGVKEMAARLAGV